MLCDKLKEIRESLGLSQRDMAKLVGIADQTLSNWENNRTDPSVEALAKFCKATNTSMDYVSGIKNFNEHCFETRNLTDEQSAHIYFLIHDLEMANELLKNDIKNKKADE